jgi:hypothetical protein
MVPRKLLFQQEIHIAAARVQTRKLTEGRVVTKPFGDRRHVVAFRDGALLRHILGWGGTHTHAASRVKIGELAHILEDCDLLVIDHSSCSVSDRTSDYNFVFFDFQSGAPGDPDAAVPFRVETFKFRGGSRW